MLEILIGTAVGAGTYLWAKNRRKASTGQSALAGVATGAASAAATAAAMALFWPALIIGLPLGAAYYIGKNRSQKALKPGSE